MLSVPDYILPFIHIVFYYGISLSMGCYITLTLYAAYFGCAAYVPRTYRVYTHVCWCPYTRGYRTKKSKCIHSRSTPFYHRCCIYLYPIFQIPFSPKGPKSKIFKIFFTDGFFIVDKVYIYTGIMIFFIFLHIKIWLPKKGFVYLHQK